MYKVGNREVARDIWTLSMQAQPRQSAIPRGELHLLTTVAKAGVALAVVSIRAYREV